MATARSTSTSHSYAVRSALSIRRVADSESSAIGWFEANELPTSLMKSSHARIAHAMAYRGHPENGTWSARP